MALCWFWANQVWLRRRGEQEVDITGTLYSSRGSKCLFDWRLPQEGALPDQPTKYLMEIWKTVNSTPGLLSFRAKVRNQSVLILDVEVRTLKTVSTTWPNKTLYCGPKQRRRWTQVNSGLCQHTLLSGHAVASLPHFLHND